MRAKYKLLHLICMPFYFVPYLLVSGFVKPKKPS